MNADSETRDTETRDTETRDTGAVASESATPKGKASVRKTVTGKVSSDKMQKTRTVEVMRLEKHPRYGKYIRRRSSYYAHDEREISHEGDTVLIAETRPLSKTKRWRVVKVLTPAGGVDKMSPADQGLAEDEGSPYESPASSEPDSTEAPRDEGGAAT